MILIVFVAFFIFLYIAMNQTYYLTKNTKTDINFEQELWKVANELRGIADENNIRKVFV